jgi:carboxyl-terminal processing protease
MKYGKILLLTAVLFTFGFILNGGDLYYRISKSIEVFGEVYKQATLNYVDEINPEKFVAAGIKGMLKSLDPYTVFYDSEQRRDVDVLTRGKYGGIGASIGLRDGKVTIMELMDGYSAQRQGIRIGDVIYSIDGVKMGRDNYESLGVHLKGEPGTIVKLKIIREGVRDTLNFELVREEIEIKNLAFYKLLGENKNIAYLKLTGFSRTAGDEILSALREMSDSVEIRGIVLDLRGNPGGLLDAAIDVAEKFLPRKSLIVSVIGRDSINAKRYYAKENPIAGKTKLAVLINGLSASASEIVTGAIQDHDRGVIVGEQSYGKGLVQTIIPLPYDNTMKITTARYYTPSGRCIQKLDYSKRVLEKPKRIAKRNYRTDNGRVVFSAGGITPDTTVTEEELPEIVEELLANAYFFKFGTYYFNKNEKSNLLSAQDLDDEKLFDNFVAYLDERAFSFKSGESELVKHLLKSEMVQSNAELSSETEKLLGMIEDAQKKELIENKDLIVKLIKLELAGHIGGRKMRIEESIKDDKQLDVALNILRNDSLYRKILQ